MSSFNKKWFRGRLLWSLVFVLSLPAYVCGIMLTLASDPNTKVSINLDRSTAVSRAREYAASLGVETDGWAAGHRLEAENDRYLYYRLNPNDTITILRRLAPELQSEVIFVAPDGAEKMRVKLSPVGAPISYAHSLPDGGNVEDKGAEASRALADSAVARLLESSSLSVVGEPEINEDRSSRSVEREYSYRLNTAGLPGLTASHDVTVVGGEVTEQETKIEIDDAYADGNLLSSSTATSVFKILNGILLGLLFLYGLYRYFRLTQQKEVPHSRTILVCLLAGATFILFGYQIEFYIFDLPRSSGIGFWAILAVSLVGYMLLGLVFGIAFASGEGDVREHYPDKLVSLDALLAGRIFSRNVAFAVLVGVALGGWTLLVERLILVPFTTRADGGQGLAEKSWQVFGGTITPLIALISPPFSGVMEAVFGLLLPLAFLHHRRLRSRKLFFSLLALLSLIVSLQSSLERPAPLIANLLVGAVFSAAVLVAFFRFDLMTAIVTIAAAGFANWVIYLAAQPARSLRQAGIVAVAVVVAMLLVETYFLFYGRLYTEADVRPLYARFLSERVQLQAEESAAREAQIRLMPQELPTQAGLELAAVCRPAHTVGGDFYDLFSLAEDRLGLFVAEGGGGGLGSALTIAFAKGFLMPRLESGAAPGDILCSLQTQLAPMLKSNEELTIAFAIIDTPRRTISYARTGEYPRVYVDRCTDESGATRAAASQDSFLETSRSWSTESMESTDKTFDDECTIREATLQMCAGDTIMFFTDGIGKALKVERSSPHEFTRAVTKRQAGKAGTSLQDSLGRAMARQARQARRIHLDDDLTAVFVRFEEAERG